MEAVEFGKGKRRKIVLIPGNMMSWRQFVNLIPLLETDFHVIAVSTDGYDGTGKTTFTTAETSAEKLELYIGEHLNGRVDLIFGESFGSATAGTLFHRQKVQVDSLFMTPVFWIGYCSPICRCSVWKGPNIWMKRTIRNGSTPKRCSSRESFSR